MLFIPQHSGQTPLNHASQAKALVVQAAPRILPLTPTARIQDDAERDLHRAQQLVAGQHYAAKVVGKGGNYQYDVLINQQLYRIQLEKPLNLGETFSLKFLAVAESLQKHTHGQTPSVQTPQFSLQQGSAPKALGLDAQLALQQNPQLPVTISPAGQMIQKVLSSQEKLAPLIKPEDLLKQTLAQTLNASMQQLPTTPVLAAMMALFLRQQLRASGLFYESHLSQFSVGQMPLNELKAEPQNQAQPDLSALVAKQLEVLETKQMHWHGLAWPGQRINWMVEVHTEAPDALGQDGDAPTEESLDVVHSRVQLDLPQLGRVSVEFYLENGRMRVTILSDEATGFPALIAAKAQLLQAFNRQNTPLQHLEIRPHAT